MLSMVMMVVAVHMLLVLLTFVLATASLELGRADLLVLFREAEVVVRIRIAIVRVSVYALLRILERATIQTGLVVHAVAQLTDRGRVAVACVGTLTAAAVSWQP